MTTKIKTVNDAYSQLRISGLTSNPTPEDVEVALMRLENMMAELPFSVGYSFEDEPDPNSLTNVARPYWQMMATNLAVRLIPDFNKVAPQALLMQASQSLSSAIAKVAAENIRHVPYPSRQPLGSGNDRRGYSQRFYSIAGTAPNDQSTIRVHAGDVDDYTYGFSAFLNTGEVISTHTVTPDDGLTLVSSSNTDTAVLYRISVDENAVSNGSLRRVKVAITTSTGRVSNVYIDFEVIA